MSSHSHIAGTPPVRRASSGLLRISACARRIGRIDLTLSAVFVLAAVFYLWTAATSMPLSLHDGAGDRYNLLATAFLHLHLYVGRAPTVLNALSDPYKPELNRAFLKNINDDVLYEGNLYFVWGPAPALVLLVPLRLIGVEPSASVTGSVYAIAGLGFALATLRVLVRQVGDVPVWMRALGGLALALSSAVPFLLRTPGVSEDVLAGGYCFVMAGVWLAAGALVERRASVPRLALMSLCFGLAAGSRPTLGLAALVLIPVYSYLRHSRSSRSLLLSLGLPFAICIALLLAYNQARFNQPFEIGSHYQLTGYDSRTAPLGRISYALPGAWLYVSSLPQPMIVFPFIGLVPPRVGYPTAIAPPEITGGLLPMAPIVVLVFALPWLWRRRPKLLGALAVPLMALAVAGAAMMLLAAYQFFASTERYEVDFATLFVLGGLAAWLALAQGPPSRRRLLLRVGGGLLVAWGCLAGFAISFFGYGNSLAVEHPQTWRTLEDIGSPLSSAIVGIIGHPVLAASFSSLGQGNTEFVMEPDRRSGVTIVSPGARTATLRATVEVLPETRYRLGVEGPGHTGAIHEIGTNGETAEVPVHLDGGLNHIELYPAPASPSEAATGAPVMRVSQVALASSR